jgi:hypothetical protein
MIPYHLAHLALPTLHLEPHKDTVLHSSFPLSPCRYSLPLLPESNLRHLECPHAVLASASTGIVPTTSGTLSCPGVGQSTTSGEPTRRRRSQPHHPTSTTTAPSLAPRILSTVAMNKSRIRPSHSSQVSNCRRPKSPNVLRFERSKSMGSRAFLKNL